MRNKLFLLGIMLVLALVAVGCGSDDNTDAASAEGKETITVTHELGETEVELNPEKVVVFDFGSLDTLNKLGIEVTGVPKANLPTYLSDYEGSSYVNVGGLMEPDFEKISEIDPDLIIISGRQADAYEDFSEIAPTVHLGVDTTNYMESFKENATTIGKIFEQEAEVETALADIDASIEKLQEQTAATEANGLIILANDGNISAYGPGSRFGLIHDVFGLKAADENIEVSSHGQNVSFEYVVEENPDYLFVIDRGAVVGGQSSAEQIVENQLVEKTKAYQNDHIIYLDPNYWYLSGGGLISVSEMVKEIETGIK